MGEGAPQADLSGAEGESAPAPAFPRWLPVGDILPENDVFFIVLNNCTLLGALVHLLFIPLFGGLGIGPMAAFNVASVAVWGAAFGLNRNGRHTAALVLVLAEGAGHAAAAVHYVGGAGGFQYYLFLAPLIVFFSPLHARGVKIALVVAPSLLYLGLDHYASTFGPVVGLPRSVLTALRYGNVVVMLTVLSLVSYYYHRVTERSRQALRAANARLEVLAATDPLTGLLNRRRMLERLHAEAARVRRSARPFTLLMVDIDHFKQVNDRYGHEVGDAVLQRLADALRESVRDVDSVARWGGEEFLVLLPETGLEGGARVAEKVRARLADGAPIAVAPSLTVGVACCGPGEDVEGCIHRADDALYAGKAAGRDRVETA